MLVTNSDATIEIQKLQRNQLEGQFFVNRFMKYVYSAQTDQFKANTTPYFQMSCSDLLNERGLHDEQERLNLRQRYGRCILEIRRSNFFKYCFQELT